MPEKNNGISIPPDFLEWRAGENKIAQPRLSENTVRCMSLASGQVTLIITTAEGRSARVVLSKKAAYQLADLLTSTADKSQPGEPEVSGD